MLGLHVPGPEVTVYNCSFYMGDGGASPKTKPRGKKVVIRAGLFHAIEQQRTLSPVYEPEYVQRRAEKMTRESEGLGKLYEIGAYGLRCRPPR